MNRPSPFSARFPVLLALAWAAACHTQASPPEAGDLTPQAGLTVPGTWSGVLPCADCPGILTTLTLRADNLFFLRRIYHDRPDGTGRDWGRWSRDAGGTIVLRGGAEGPGRWAVLHPDTLLMLDTEGRPIASKLPYRILRQSAVDRLTDTVRIRGMYTYLADAGGMVECLTGRRFPVAMEADNVALERAYQSARGAPGAPLLVSLSGQFAERPRLEGSGTQGMIVPIKFDRAWPGEDCGGRDQVNPLVGTPS